MPEIPRYPYVVVDVDELDTDEASALLFELGASGVEERDATTMVRGMTGKVTLVGSFEDATQAQEAARTLPDVWTPRVEEVVGDAWRDEWKKHFEPFPVCEGVVVRPPWREYAAAPGERVVVLEPGRAFGTGLHETTSLVAEALAEESLTGVTVLDVGCGSGILALIALTLGTSMARAVDVDPDAVAVTLENAERNGFMTRIEVDATPIGDLTGAYPVVLANIESMTLVAIAPALMRRLAPGGLLVLSGILAPHVAPAQLEDVRRAYVTLREVGVRTKGEWIAVSMRKVGSPLP